MRSAPTRSLMSETQAGQSLSLQTRAVVIHRCLEMSYPVRLPGVAAVRQSPACVAFDQLGLLCDPFAAGLVVGVQVGVADDPPVRPGGVRSTSRCGSTVYYKSLTRGRVRLLPENESRANQIVLAEY